MSIQLPSTCLEVETRMKDLHTFLHLKSHGIYKKTLFNTHTQNMIFVVAHLPHQSCREGSFIHIKWRRNKKKSVILTVLQVKPVT
ncbi:hypothetical protein Hanom_Chr04g00367041 [Helianthus anomalus]